MGICKATTAQVTPADVFDVTVRMTDSDAKLVMDKTPSVSFDFAGRINWFYEMNPVHMVPGTYRIRLQKGVAVTIPQGTELTLNY